MMTNPQQPITSVMLDEPRHVVFQGAHLVREGYLVVPAAAAAFAESEVRLTVVFLRREGTWVAFKIHETVLSIASSELPTLELLLLCRNGDVYRAHSGGIEKEATIGYGFAAITRGGQRYYCCGTEGRIAVRERPGVWAQTSITATSKLPSLLVAICGSSDDDLWTVGLGGAAFHFDGSRWKGMDTGINVHLYKIACSEKGQAYASGKNGILLRMTLGQSKLLNEPTEDGPDFWGLEIMRDAVLMSSTQGLWAYHTGRLRKVDLPAKVGSDTHFLTAYGNECCSVGDRSICCFDGTSWSVLEHPLAEPAQPIGVEFISPDVEESD